MRIRSVEEVATGSDDVMAAEFSRRRGRLGISIGAAARATGAGADELAALENGAIAAFGNVERARLVILAYCDYLDCDPGPMLGRLEAYGRRPGMAASGARAGDVSLPRRRLRPAVAAAGLALLFVAGLAVLIVLSGR
ncbi:MAG: hypothetical protein KDJ46_10175 [Rhodobiaceae bacterium]|nr:hypothetical protein [Rhodobiaceae bacterium]